MPKGLVKVLLISGIVLHFGEPGFSQSQVSLTLSSATAAAGNPVALNLSLASAAGSEPAAVQWTLSYPPDSVASINVTAGAASAAAGKTISCAGPATAYICIASGSNLNTIANGVVAIVSVGLTSNANTTAIGVSNTLAASPAGAAIAVSATGGSIAVAAATTAPLTVSSLSCAPGSIGPTGSSTCTLTLGAAAGTAGASVAVTSSSSSLAVPASVTVPAGSSSVDFAAVAGSFSSDQTATITSALNGSSAQTSVALVSPVLVSSLQCAAATLGANSNTSCTVALSKAAPASGVSVTLTNTATALSTPASVTAPAGATSAAFTISTAAIPSDQTATITATLNGSSAQTSVALVSPVLVSSLQCAAATLGANSNTSCTVALSKAAPASGVSVTLTNTATALSVPASVTAPAGATSAAFTISTAAIPSDQTATITAALNGSSAQTSVALVSPVLVSSLQCAAASLAANTSTTCTVALSKAAQIGGATVSLSSSATTLSVPASATVPSGGTSATFTASTGAISAAQTVVIAASLNGSSQTASLSLVLPATVSALSCAPASLLPNTSATCTVTLSQAAAAGGAVVGITVNTPNLTVPASATVPAGAVSASFTVSAGAFTNSETAVISASLGSASTSATISLTPAPTTTLLSIHGDATEVSGVSNGASVSPAIAPSGLKGKVVVNGNGSVNFVPGNGVYFLNCCSSANGAYYKFTGSAVGSMFNVRQGQISFTLQSRSGFAGRQATAASQRYSFAAQDGNGEQFYFLTQVVSGSLVFNYMAEGSGQSYYVPQGTEDRLFGNGVNLNVVMAWDGSTVSLTLNGVPAKSSPYIPAAAQWNGTSKFDLGAHELPGLAGSNVSDDLIRDFTVTAFNGTSGKAKPRLVSSQLSGKDWSFQTASRAVKFREFSCGALPVTPGSAAICRLAMEPGAVVDQAELSITSSSETLRIPATVVTRPGRNTVWFELLAHPEASPGTVVLTARSTVDSIRTSVEIVQSEAPKLSLPKTQTSKPGSPVQFDVIAFDERPYSLSATDLPPGAIFDTATGAFRWEPTDQNWGSRNIAFRAVNSLGLVTTKTVEVRIVDEPQTGPEILTVGDTDQALALYADSSMLASVPNVRYDGEPARPGEVLSIFATGIDCRQGPAMQYVHMRFGDRYAPVSSIEPVDGSTGVCRISVEVPSTANQLRTQVSLSVIDSKGRIRSSKSAFVAVER